jgi:adenylate kinase
MQRARSFVATSSSLALRALSTNEVKDASLIFNAAWGAVEGRVGRECVGAVCMPLCLFSHGPRDPDAHTPRRSYCTALRSNLKFPKELICLGGAPGSGKGTNTGYILRERDISAPPIVVSSLLNSPAAQAVKAAGGMVGDKEVVEALLDTLLDPQYANGVIVDGFPRTSVQAEVAKLYHSKLTDLHLNVVPSIQERPIIRIAVLFVDEMVSVERQMGRGLQARAHNEKVKKTGLGELQEERPTDFDTALAQRRYKTFNEVTFTALEELANHFVYNFINAGGTMAAVEQNIKDEMQYQSSVELNRATFDVVSQLPLASTVTANARQELVRRMDGYSATAEGVASLERVVEILREQVLPVVESHAIAGTCEVVVSDPALESAEARQQVLDLLSERGFRSSARPGRTAGALHLKVVWAAPTGLGMKRKELV